MNAIRRNVTTKHLRGSCDSLPTCPSTPTASFPELPTAHGELYEMLHRWWDIELRLLLEVKETQSPDTASHRQEELLHSIKQGQREQNRLLWGLSADARELLCTHRRVSIPGTVFEFQPAEDGEERIFDQLVGRSALSLFAT